MSDDAIHLVYGSDDNYWFPTAVSAASAALGCSLPLVIHLFDAGVTDAHWAEFSLLVRKANPATVCVRNVLDAKMFEGFGAWRGGSLVTYSRMFMQDILPDIDWAVYVDGDTLWLGDLAKLWALRDPEEIIQASVDPPMPRGLKHPDEDWYRDNGLAVDRAGYLCMGLMIANLQALRRFGLTDRVRAFMAKYPQPRVVDQTVLNSVCQGRMAPLPIEWGVFSTWHGTANLRLDACIHYVNDVPWRRDKLNRLVSDVVLLWYEFAERVLDLSLRRRYLSRLDWLLRRGAFVVCKYLQPLVRLNGYVHSRLRNTHGLMRCEWKSVVGRWGGRG